LLSPTGKYLVINYYNKQEDGSNLFRTILTETATQRVIWTKNEYAGCTWMPQRDVLYYTRKGNDSRQLMTYNPVDGTENVISEGIPEGNFMISPKEDYLIYTITEEGEKPKESLKLLIDPDDRQPGWRNRSTLYRYDLKTCQRQRLTFGSVSVGINDISRDGQYLLLTYSRMNPNDRPFRRMTLLRMNAYTGLVDTLLTDTAYVAGAQFSPDAKKVLIKASPAAFDGIGLEVKEGQIPNAFDYRLYVYNIDDKTVEPLLCLFNPAVGKTIWSPIDGNIYFSATDGYDESLFQLNPQNKKVIKYELPVSYIQGYSLTSLSKRPQVVFFGQTGERARDMYFCTLNSHKPKTEKIGNIDFDACYQACKDIGVQYIVIEQDNCYDLDPYKSVEIGFAGLNRIAERNK
jgi:Tol biopolymer transport system component